MIVAALAACSGSPRRIAQKIAILPFENLTGDDSLDWIASAAPAIVDAEIAEAGSTKAFRAAEVSAAYAGGATRLLHGYYTGGAGQLRFEVETEDASRHKIVEAMAERGDVLKAMNAVAKRIDPSARGFSTANEEAIAAWGRGEYERAVTLDPKFGAAWLSWIDSLAARGATADALDVAHRALSQAGLKSEIDRTKIEVASAALSGDVAARARALTRLAALEPNDPPLLNTLAEAELIARNFAAAASAYEKIAAIDPNNAAALNSLGYARALAGDLDGARKAFEEYGKQPAQALNMLDSLGEAYFMNARFADAEKLFLRAYQQNPAFLGGADLYKATVAHWLGGDLAGADSMFKRYLDSQRDDRLRPWRQACWLYTTGRREQAIAALESSPDKTLAARQLAIWNAGIRQDIESLQKKYENTPPPADGQARTFYAAALAASGDKDQARKLLRLWPLPEQTGDPLVESMVLPEFIALRKSLGVK
ncbi:MAG TPA: tetratricopeptide repeat protein [Bryobacteraceae bacterium]|jgi:tetratricopeptide (TPR) repeat protein|nr:tetratricopeptide repeat protein [Bryobacteraceae bacterium]